MEGLSNVTVAEGVCRQSPQRERFLPLQNINEETRKQSEFVDGALIRADPLYSASQSAGILPIVGAYTAQCAKCMKWRFIPTKSQFESIRHSIFERPFLCSNAIAWRPHASCDDPFEISPDLHELWAYDKPGIPLPPDGWERLLVIRPQGSVKFADIYYATPSGKKLRSMPEIERFLSEHPEYAHQGVTLSQFSFVGPRPLDKDYCRKKNESLTSGEKSATSQKAPKSIPSDAHLGLAQPSFKVVSTKPKLEKLKFRKKPVSGVFPCGEPQGLHSEEQSSDLMAFQQVTKSPISFQGLASMNDTSGAYTAAGSSELEKSTLRNCAASTSEVTETSSAFAASKDQHAMSIKVESAN